MSKARSDRATIDPLSDTEPDLDLPTGYIIQAQLREQAGPLVGWKLGITSRAKQTQMGLNAPIRGYLTSTMALDMGTPLPTEDHIHPRAEPEIAFVLGRDLAGPMVTTNEVLAATESITAGIEILDSRYHNYRFTAPDVVADNTSAARFVTGAPVAPAGIDLRLVGVILTHNGEVVATASGAASLGHPAAAVAWLARSLAEYGETLRASQIVLSGGLTPAVEISKGDTITVSIDRLSSVELACR